MSRWGLVRCGYKEEGAMLDRNSDLAKKAILCANDISKKMSDYIRAVCFNDVTYIKSNAEEARNLLNELLRIESDIAKHGCTLKPRDS